MRFRNEPLGDKVFDILNMIFMTLMLFITFYPLYFIVIASISGVNEVNNGLVWLYPKSLNFDGYLRMLKQSAVWRGYANTIVYTVLGTLINLAVTLTAAFALSRKSLYGRNVIMGIFVFTMYFGGGMIPTYFLIKNLRMIDTLWAIIIPGAVSVYNLIVARTFFSSSIPDGVLEAAKIDGCNYFTMFFKIVLPLSGAITAVLTLYYGVAHWNSYFNAMMYLNDRDKFPLQLILREMLVQTELMTELMQQGTIAENENAMKNIEAMKYGLIIVSSAPVLMLYPFLQKYFVKGVMIGAIKE